MSSGLAKHKQNRRGEKMPFKIIADSSCEVPQSHKAKCPVITVPFKLYIDDEEIVDDSKLDVLGFIGKMVKSSTLPRTACPSPVDFQAHFHEEDPCFVVTISSKLSGTYNSAMLAKSMHEEENPNHLVHIFDSKSASVGELLVSLKISELAQLNFNPNEIIQQVTEYIDNMKTFFIAESLDNLMKNGRISRLKGTLASVLNIKPIMGADNGEIILMDKARGSAKAFARMLEMIKDNAKQAESKILAISHVNNPDRANWLKSEIEKVCQFKEVIVVQTGGLSSLYCDNQGIIVAF